MSMTNEQGTVVLFGGGGFVGRAVAQALFARGYRVRVAQRIARDAHAVRTLGGLGQSQLVAVDITDADQVANALQGAVAAVNLVGILKGAMRDVHVLGARNIAEAAAKAGLSALVHVSAIGADPGSDSNYGRTKGEGEAAVRAAFPQATILRPSLIFGRDDGFTNRFADLIATGCSLPFHIVPILRGAVKFQPAHVADVAQAIASAAADPGRFGGETFELGGPDVLTLAEINHWIAREIGRKPNFVAVPDGVARLLASATGWAPGAPITPDQYKMLLRDNVVAENAKGFAAFGIRPAPMAAIAPAWLERYRKQGRFSRPLSA